ncbi:hypothetical protein [Methanooceanicella nereidis]|nr:hypothetical protein [Methanocella sp. CWC-04]
MLRWTGEIIKRCRDSTPLGLVKGSNTHQITGHADILANMGVCCMVFHTGDFLHRSTLEEVRRARHYVREIKQRGYNLLLYGIGPSNFVKFSNADGFITQSHYVSAFYGKEYKNGKWVQHDKGDISLIMKNLVRIDLKARQIKNNGGLKKWVEVSDGTESPMRQDTHKMAVAVPQIGQ